MRFTAVFKVVSKGHIFHNHIISTFRDTADKAAAEIVEQLTRDSRNLPRIYSYNQWSEGGFLLLSEDGGIYVPTEQVAGFYRVPKNYVRYATLE